MTQSDSHPIVQAFIPILKGMCRNSETLKYREMRTGNNLVLRIMPQLEDFRIICGKGGRQINALRFLINRAGKRLNISTQVELEDTYSGQPGNSNKFEPDPKFNANELESLLNSVIALVFEKEPRRTISRIGDRLKIYFDVGSENSESIATVIAIADLFYPYGYRNGCKVEIKPLNHTHIENHIPGPRPLSCGERD